MHILWHHFPEPFCMYLEVYILTGCLLKRCQDFFFWGGGTMFWFTYSLEKCFTYHRMLRYPAERRRRLFERLTKLRLIICSQLLLCETTKRHKQPWGAALTQTPRCHAELNHRPVNTMTFTFQIYIWLHVRPLGFIANVWKYFRHEFVFRKLYGLLYQSAFIDDGWKPRLWSINLQIFDESQSRGVQQNACM